MRRRSLPRISTLSLTQTWEFFRDGECAERYFIESRWPAGVACPFCGSLSVRARPQGKPQPFRCSDCAADFSVKPEPRNAQL